MASSGADRNTLQRGRHRRTRRTAVNRSSTGGNDVLVPLPDGPFVLATRAKAKISRDIHAQVDLVLYSLP
jgi:hypothetical protein